MSILSTEHYLPVQLITVTVIVDVPSEIYGEHDIIDLSAKDTFQVIGSVHLNF